MKIVPMNNLRRWPALTQRSYDRPNYHAYRLPSTQIVGHKKKFAYHWYQCLNLVIEGSSPTALTIVCPCHPSLVWYVARPIVGKVPSLNRAEARRIPRTRKQHARRRQRASDAAPEGKSESVADDRISRGYLQREVTLITYLEWHFRSWILPIAIND